MAGIILGLDDLDAYFEGPSHEASKGVGYGFKRAWKREKVMEFWDEEQQGNFMEYL